MQNGDDDGHWSRHAPFTFTCGIFKNCQMEKWKFTCERNEMCSTGYHIDKIIEISISIDALLLKVNNFVILTRNKFTVAQMPQFCAECFVQCEYTFSVEKYFTVFCAMRCRCGAMYSCPYRFRCVFMLVNECDCVCVCVCGSSGGRNERINV